MKKTLVAAAVALLTISASSAEISTTGNSIINEGFGASNALTLQTTLYNDFADITISISNTGLTASKDLSNSVLGLRVSAFKNLDLQDNNVILGASYKVTKDIEVFVRSNSDDLFSLDYSVRVDQSLIKKEFGGIKDISVLVGYQQDEIFVNVEKQFENFKISVPAIGPEKEIKILIFKKF